MKENVPTILFITILCFGVLTISYSKNNDRLNKANQVGYLQSQFTDIDYNIVYVRCPRGREPVYRPKSGSPDPLLNWSGVNDLWLSASNNIYHQPGCDLVLHNLNLSQGSLSVEQVLVECGELDMSTSECTVTDSNVSFDGRYIVYSKYMDTRNLIPDFGVWEINSYSFQTFIWLNLNGELGNSNNNFAQSIFGGFKHYDKPALIIMRDLQTETEIQISSNKLFAERTYLNKFIDWGSSISAMVTNQLGELVLPVAVKKSLFFSPFRIDGLG